MRTKFSLDKICVLASLFAIVAPGSIQAAEFDGPYVGAEAGIGILKMEGTTLGGPADVSDNSGLLSGVLGYRSPVGEDGRFVLGLEGVLGLYTSGTNMHYGVYGIGGYRVGENGLVYLRVGYGGLNGVQTATGSGVDGPVFGGGYEVSLQENISLRLDYRYLSYGDVNVPDNAIDYSGHEITTAVLFSF